MLDDKKTIFALATPPGKSGVAIIRISGPEAFSSLKKLTTSASVIPRQATLRNIYDPKDHQLVDKSVIITFPAPHSFTGEDIVELHIHGSRAVINIIISILSKFSNLRLANPGEFAKRAFLNGKMDLTAAEGLGDLIDAETSIQQKQAIRQMEGTLANIYDTWRSSLIHLLALLEAFLDFPEEDIPTDIMDEVHKGVKNLKNSIYSHLNDQNKGEIIRRGIYIAILGAPNVGKSTLLNHLTKRDVAIVSSIAGTTRDVIEINIDLDGYPVTIADTAGIRNSEDIIELEGINRAFKKADHADIKLIILDASNPSSYDPEILSMIDLNTIVLINKIDQEQHYTEIEGSIKVAINKNIGLDIFLQSLSNLITKKFSLSSDPLVTRERHRYHLNNCYESLSRFTLDKPLELACEDLRLSSRSLGQIVGTINVENILDEIFINFCIGK